MDIIGLVALIVQIGDLQAQIWFAAVQNEEVHVFLGTTNVKKSFQEYFLSNEI